MYLKEMQSRTDVILARLQYVCLVVCVCLTFAPVRASAIATSYVQPSSETTFHEAMSFFDQKQYALSQSYLERYIGSNGRKYQKETAAYYRVLAALGNRDPHVETLVHHFVTAYPNHPQTDVLHYRLAQCCFTRGDLHKSLSLFKQVHLTKWASPDRMVFFYDLANVYHQLKDFVHAQVYFSKIQDKNHTCYYPAKLRLAAIAFEQENYTGALALLQEVGEHPNYLFEARGLTLKVYYKANLFQDLLTYMKSWSFDSFTPKEQMLIADAYFFLQAYASAIPCYQAYLAHEATDEVARVKLAHALFCTQRYKEALTYLQQLDKDNPTGQVASYYSGLVYAQEGEQQAAIASFDKAAKRLFDLAIHDLALLKRAAIYYQQGAMEDVIQSMHHFMESRQESKYLTLAQFLLAKSYYKKKAYKQAIDYVTALPYKDAQLLRLYQKLLFYQGLETYNNQNFQEAVHYLKQSLSFPFKPPLVNQAQFWLAEAFSQLAAHPKALKYYTTLVEKKTSIGLPYYEKILYGLAYAHFNMGNYSSASQTFAQYIAFTKKHPATAYYDALLRLGDCCYVEKKYTQALLQYEAVYNHYPAYVRYQEALIYQLLGDTVRAEQCLQELIVHHAQTPYYAKARYQQACILFNSGHYEAAIKQFSNLIEKSLNDDLQPYLLLKRALAYENLQKYQEASADYIAILDRYPSHVYAEGALTALSSLLAKQGASEEIETYLNKYAHVAATHRSDTETIDRAKQFFYHQAYGKVIEQLTVFATKYPQSPLLTEANFLVAESYFRLKQIKKALAYYAKIVAADKEATVFYQKSMLRVADIAYQNKQYQKALDYYQKLQQLSLAHKTYLHVLMGTVQASFALKHYQITTPTCLRLLNDPDLPVEIRQQADLYLGKVAMQQSAYQNAKNRFLKAHMPLHTAAAAEAQYLLACVHFNLKAYKASLHALFALVEKYPQNKDYIDVAYLLMADNYQMLGNLSQAQATLTSIINQSKDSKTIARAKRKREVILRSLKK